MMILEEVAIEEEEDKRDLRPEDPRARRGLFPSATSPYRGEATKIFKK